MYMNLQKNTVKMAIAYIYFSYAYFELVYFLIVKYFTFFIKQYQYPNMYLL